MKDCCWIAKSCWALCNPMDCCWPGSSVHGVFFQTRMLEWVAISFSRGSSRPKDRTYVSWIGRWILYHWAAREVLNERLPVITHLPKPIEWIPQRVNCNINYGLWVLLMCQCRFISCNKCTALVRDVDNRGGHACVGAGHIWEISVPFP